eukprot:m.84440 g.84440  ORF g.84440 m.84440 type:complete len:283 (+) comp12966_c0_seq3:176-1024(+)
MLRVAVAQMRSTGDVVANLAVVTDLVKEAKAKDVKFISFPECFEWMGTGPKESIAQACELDGELMGKYKEIAKRYSMWISLGGFHEKLKDSDKIGNTHCLLGPNGSLVASYKKSHLFDVDIADGKFLESSFTERGNEAVLVDSVCGAKVGLTTCYDLRFPALFSNLQDAGSDIILVPSAFMVSTGQAHWEVLLRARAIETQSYIMAAAQAGKHNEKRTSYGHSMIIDPWGEIVAEMDGVSKGIAVATIDFEKLAEVRRKMPVLHHRNQVLYKNIVNTVTAKI